MDDEARLRLIADATVQNAREEAKRARQNLPIGIVLCALGAAISTALLLVLEVPGLVQLFGIGMGFVMIPGGLAVIIKSAATIARSNKIEREHALPQARVVD